MSYKVVGNMKVKGLSSYILMIRYFLGCVYSEKCEDSEDHRLKRQVNGIPLIYPYGGTYKLLIGFATPVKLKDGMSLLFAVNFQYQYIQFTNISQLSQYYYVKDVSRERELKDVSMEREFKDVSIDREFKDVSRERELKNVSMERELKDVSTERELKDESTERELKDVSTERELRHVSREKELREVDLWNRKDERITFYEALAGLLNSRGMNGQECLLRAICEAAQYPVENEGLVGEIMHILLTPDYGHTAFDEDDEDYHESIAPYRDAAIVGRQMFSCPSVFKGCPDGQGVMELISMLRDE